MSIKYAVIGLLHYRDMHGYQIKGHIEKNFGQMWTVNYGQVYTTLKTLLEEGLIDLCDVVPSEVGAPQKKLYSLTEKGRAEFKRWLAASPEKQMLLRDPFLLRFIFFSFGEREDALRIIDEQIGFYENQLGRRQAHLAKWEDKGTYVRQIAELGLEFNELLLKWLVRVRAEISASTAEHFKLARYDML